MEMNGPFSRWLCDSLDAEADRAIDAGQLPLRPVWLSELEAMALLIVALDSEVRSSFLADAASRLAKRLSWRLDHSIDPRGC